MSRQVSRGSVGEYQADAQAGVAQLRSQVSGRWAGRCRAAPLPSIRQMSGQRSRPYSFQGLNDKPSGEIEFLTSLNTSGP